MFTYGHKNFTMSESVQVKITQADRRHTHIQPQQYNGLGKDKRNSFESHEKVILCIMIRVKYLLSGGLHFKNEG